jgi:hypothetical protein
LSAFLSTWGISAHQRESGTAGRHKSGR